MDQVVEDLLSCLDDPALALLQWNEAFGVVQVLLCPCNPSSPPTVLLLLGLSVRPSITDRKACLSLPNATMPAEVARHFLYKGRWCHLGSVLRHGELAYNPPDAMHCNNARRRGCPESSSRGWKALPQSWRRTCSTISRRRNATVLHPGPQCLLSM